MRRHASERDAQTLPRAMQGVRSCARICGDALRSATARLSGGAEVVGQASQPASAARTEASRPDGKAALNRVAHEREVLLRLIEPPTSITLRVAHRSGSPRARSAASASAGRPRWCRCGPRTPSARRGRQSPSRTSCATGLRQTELCRNRQSMFAVAGNRTWSRPPRPIAGLTLHSDASARGVRRRLECAVTLGGPILANQHPCLSSL